MWQDHGQILPFEGISLPVVCCLAIPLDSFLSDLIKLDLHYIVIIIHMIIVIILFIYITRKQVVVVVVVRVRRHRRWRCERGSIDDGGASKAVVGVMEVVTHILESADRGTSENGKRNRARDGHSPTGERRQRTKSEWQKEQSERWALTFCGAQTEEQIRMAKETERARALTL
jgi:hypothetical protein